MSFGANLEELLKKRGWSARELAKRLSLPAKSIQEYVGKDGRFPRDAEVIRRIADALEISVHRLMYGTDDPRELLGSLLEKTEIHSGLYEISIKRVTQK